MNWEKFSAWLSAQGAEVLAPTNPYEMVRFRAHGMVNVVYRNKQGVVNAQGFAAVAMDAFGKGASLGMGYTAPRKSMSQNVRAALLKRDGNECFFCAAEMTPEETTIEHLIGKGKGGTDHMDNLVLAHEKCNREAANIPLIAKVRIYHRARSKVAA